MNQQRIAHITRQTTETSISLQLNIDGNGNGIISTGIGFFDHMLNGFCRHGFFDMNLTLEGDLEVDSHHSVEDTGIVLGTCISQALGDKKGINRYGHFLLPMDETLVLVAIDLSGRPYFSFDYEFTNPRVGGFDTEMVREFFYAISYSAGMNLHIKVLSGNNTHHIIEAIFKGFSKALDMATQYNSRVDGIPSTKGIL